MKHSNLVCLFFACFISAQASEQVVHYKISSVTVFRDRAQVTRTFSGDLFQGINTSHLRPPFVSFLILQYENRIVN